MRLRVNKLLLLVVFLAFAGCVSAIMSSKAEPTASGSVAELLIKHNLGRERPLLGDYDAGARAFKSGKGEADAIAYYSKNGAAFVLFCGFSCVPVGIDDLGSVKKIMSNQAIGKIYIPASSDIRDNEKQEYFEASQGYAEKFNLKMLTLSEVSTAK